LNYYWIVDNLCWGIKIFCKFTAIWLDLGVVGFSELFGRGTRRSMAIKLFP
jgi:hypothetical protein